MARDLGRSKGTRDCAQPTDGLASLPQVRMIAEELVASGGAQVQDTKIPVEHPQAAGAAKLRVSISIHVAGRALGLPALEHRRPSAETHVMPKYNS